jgi:hypothetical protein
MACLPVEDEIVKQRQKLLEGRPTDTRIDHIYRVRMYNNKGKPEEFYYYTLIISGRTAINNYVEYELPPSSTCWWLEPITRKQVIFDPQKEDMKEITVEDDLSKTIKHMEYPVNADNTKMVAELIKNSDKSKEIRYYVLDDRTNFSRAVDSWEDLSTRPFDELLALDRYKNRPVSEIDELKRQIQMLRGALQDNINNNQQPQPQAPNK